MAINLFDDNGNFIISINLIYSDAKNATNTFKL